MKCIVLTFAHYKRKSDGKDGTIANVVFLRPDKFSGEIRLNVQQLFNLSDLRSGDILDVETDFKGFPVSSSVIGHSESVELLTSELAGV